MLIASNPACRFPTNCSYIFRVTHEAMRKLTKLWGLSLKGDTRSLRYDGFKYVDCKSDSG